MDEGLTVCETAKGVIASRSDTSLPCVRCIYLTAVAVVGVVVAVAS